MLYGTITSKNLLSITLNQTFEHALQVINADFKIYYQWLYLVKQFKSSKTHGYLINLGYKVEHCKIERQWCTKIPLGLNIFKNTFFLNVND